MIVVMAVIMVLLFLSIAVVARDDLGPEEHPPGSGLQRRARAGRRRALGRAVPHRPARYRPGRDVLRRQQRRVHGRVDSRRPRRAVHRASRRRQHLHRVLEGSRERPVPRDPGDRGALVPLSVRDLRQDERSRSTATAATTTRVTAPVRWRPSTRAATSCSCPRPTSRATARSPVTAPTRPRTARRTSTAAAPTATTATCCPACYNPQDPTLNCPAPVEHPDDAVPARFAQRVPRDRRCAPRRAHARRVLLQPVRSHRRLAVVPVDVHGRPRPRQRRRGRHLHHPDRQHEHHVSIADATVNQNGDPTKLRVYLKGGKIDPGNGVALGRLHRDPVGAVAPRKSTRRARRTGGARSCSTCSRATADRTSR